MSNTISTYERLSKYLATSKYTFVCPSPETAGRVVQKRNSDSLTKNGQNAQDFFGWSLPCTRYARSKSKSILERSRALGSYGLPAAILSARIPCTANADQFSRQTLKSIIPDDIFESLLMASIITASDDNEEYRSKIRVSNFYLPNISNSEGIATPLYYIHSSYPTSSDSVFFGPDTYLFTSFLKNNKHHLPQDLSSVIDVCCGSGAGAIHLARAYPQAKVLGLDLNPCALRLGGVNAYLADVKVDFHMSDLYAAIPDESKKSGIDLIVSNPPYIASSADGKDLPMYADGGAGFGLDISVRIVEEGVEILSDKGVIIIYTGVAIMTTDPGHDPFLGKLQAIRSLELVEYTILHPDMWPEEIGHGAYAEVGRIQVVGAVLRRS